MNNKKNKEVNRFYKKFGFKHSRNKIHDRYHSLETELADQSYIREVVNYYKKIGCKNFSPLVHLLIDQRIGVKSKYFLPDELRGSVMRVLNGHDRKKYIDKNIYPLIVNTHRQPNNVVRHVNGKFFNGSNESMDVMEIFKLLENDRDYIVKPSMTAGGQMVGICRRQDSEILYNGLLYSFSSFSKLYGDDFTIQEKVVQSDIVAQIHPESVNTLRLVTLRWNNEIHYMLGFLRIGSGSAVNDNAASGGLCAGLSDRGVLNDYAVDKSGRVLFTHPTTGFSFKNNNVQILNFDRFKEFVVNLHSDVLHHNLISWDIAVGKDNLPFFIEHNFGGQFWMYQYSTGKPLFGDFSDEILKHIVQEDRYVTLNPSFKFKRYGPFANDEFIMNTKLKIANLLRVLKLTT
jgi:hypothetical protein